MRAPLAACVLLAGCGGGGGGPVLPVAEQAAPAWRQVATPSDRERLRGWRTAWLAAVAQARAGGHAADLARDGALFDPDRALENAALPPGDYRCRVTKLGGRGDVGLPYVAYPAFPCRIDRRGAVLGFEKMGGSQRPVGMFFPDTAARAVFLGTLVLGDEARALDYGRDAERDMAGIVERIGPARWRLVLPYPRFESTLDVIELVPAGR